jgi:3-deoxy-7-phosphoheptulonate synthase
MVEVHPNPDQALKDGAQSLTFDSFQQLMMQLAPVASSVNRKLPAKPGDKVDK